MILDLALEFSDAQALASISSGASTKSTNVVDMRTGLTDAWGSTKKPELGGLTFNARVNTIMVGASAIINAQLVTKNADASISSGATVLATLQFPAASAAGTKKSFKLPPGTECYRYVGVLYAASGAQLTSAKFDTFLSLDDEGGGAL